MLLLGLSLRAIKEAALITGLVEMKAKKKEMTVNRNITNAKKDLIIDGLVLEGVQSFRYLGTLINSRSVISEKIKSRIAEGNICFDNLGQIFRS